MSMKIKTYSELIKIPTFEERFEYLKLDGIVGQNQGDFACRENSIAITKLEEALLWLNKRTQDRIARNVEGTSQK